MTLPNFLIVGGQKCGTTSMYHYLAQHPDVFMSPVKEPAYYAREVPTFSRAIRTAEEYERLFYGVRGERAIGEASTLYLVTPGTPELVREALPGVRIIASLRNPVDRAWSSYLQLVREGWETRGWREAVRPGEPIFEIGLYSVHLRRWMDRFPARDMKVILFDDFSARPGAVVRELFAFLGVDPEVPVDTSKRSNPAALPRSMTLNRLLIAAQLRVGPHLPKFLRQKGYGSRIRSLLYRKPDPFPEELRRQLCVLYREDILATGALIGRDLTHWLC